MCDAPVDAGLSSCETDLGCPLKCSASFEKHALSPRRAVFQYLFGSDILNSEGVGFRSNLWGRMNP